MGVKSETPKNSRTSAGILPYIAIEKVKPTWPRVGSKFKRCFEAGFDPTVDAIASIKSQTLNPPPLFIYFENPSLSISPPFYISNLFPSLSLPHLSLSISLPLRLDMVGALLPLYFHLQFRVRVFVLFLELIDFFCDLIGCCVWLFGLLF